ncbi:MAG: hypothetical protein ACLQVG_03935 [Terriglobia bacterium]
MHLCNRASLDGGFFLGSEFDAGLSFGELAALQLNDSRREKNMQLPLADQWRPNPHAPTGNFRSSQSLTLFG